MSSIIFNMDIGSFTRFLNWFLMIALPVILGIFLTLKFHFGWKIWLIGACTFIISQIFHIPFNKFVLNPILGNIQPEMSEVSASLVIAILLGLSAGIFEECSRYGMYRWWLKDKRSWRNSIMAGAGHGGIESIILGVLVMLTYINLMAYRNIDLNNLSLSTDQISIARQQIQMYWSLPWYDSMLGALERSLTIPFQIAASVLVLQVFTRKPGHRQLRWLGLAILYHAALDASAVFISQQWNVYVVEAVLAASVILDIIIIFSLRQPEPEPVVSIPIENTNETPAFTPAPIEETSENLEKTRYQ
jgi:uncharacterized membrane protein YhfC